MCFFTYEMRFCLALGRFLVYFLANIRVIKVKTLNPYFIETVLKIHNIHAKCTKNENDGIEIIAVTLSFLHVTRKNEI